jgi:hypothetical protein
VNYAEMSNGAKNQFVRDLCRVTGCAPIKGAKTTRAVTLRSLETMLLAAGANEGISRDGKHVYQAEVFIRKGVTYRRVRVRLVKV